MPARARVLSSRWFPLGLTLWCVCGCGDRGESISKDIAALESAPSPPRREQAARRLAERGDLAAVEPLCRGLQDSDSVVRRAAARALGAFPDVRAAQCLYEVATADPLLANADTEFEAMMLAGEAAEALGRIGAPAVDLILQGLEKPRLHIFVDDRLVRALGNSGEGGRIKLREIWAGCATQLHRGGAVALVALGEVGPLIEALAAPKTEDADRRDCERWRRSAAVEALGKATDDRSRDALAEILAKSEGFELLAAASALLSRRVIDPVLAVLASPDPARRRTAAKALASSRLPEAAVALDRTLAERDLAAVAGGVEYHVRRGREGSEATLLAALDAVGGTEMAIPLASCGNPLLEGPARAYLDARGLELLAGAWYPKGEYRLDVRTVTLPPGVKSLPSTSDPPVWGVQ